MFINLSFNDTREVDWRKMKGSLFQERIDLKELIFCTVAVLALCFHIVPHGSWVSEYSLIIFIWQTWFFPIDWVATFDIY